MTVITQLIPLPLETKVLLFNLKRKKLYFNKKKKDILLKLFFENDVITYRINYFYTFIKFYMQNKPKQE